MRASRTGFVCVSEQVAYRTTSVCIESGIGRGMTATRDPKADREEAEDQQRAGIRESRDVWALVLSFRLVESAAVDSIADPSSASSLVA